MIVPMDTTITTAEPEIAPRLAALKLETAVALYEGLLEPGGFEEWLAYYCTGTRIVEFMANRSYFYVGPGHRPHGMVGVEVDGERAQIVDLYVRPDEQRGGYGTALLAHAERWARSEGALTAEIDLFAPYEAGRRFVAARGYREVSALTEEHSKGEVIRCMRLLEGADGEPDSAEPV